MAKKSNKLQDIKDQIDKTEAQADELLKQAEMITKMIPGDADDKLLQNIKKQVDTVTEKYDQLKKNLPGS